VKTSDGKAARSRYWLLAPIILLYGTLAVLPLTLIVTHAFEDGLDHFRTIASSVLFWPIVGNTVVISLCTTAAAVSLGYILAAAMWCSRPPLRRVLLAVTLLPFWSGVLVKNFAWSALLQDNGVINGLLQTLALRSAPLPLLHNRFAVVVGMVHYVLPYAVFPIFATMLGIDGTLTRAAESLGATRSVVLFQIVGPLTLPGVYAAALLVLIMAGGFFITPVLLGGPQNMMVANLVNYYANELVDFGSAAALAVTISIGVAVLMLLYHRIPKEGQYGRA